MMGRRLDSVLVPLFGALLSAISLSAQQVRSRAFVGADSLPIGGVLIELVDSLGLVRSRGLTSLEGRINLRASGPGLYRLRALQIGFFPTYTPPFRVASSDVTIAGFRLDRLPVRLPETVITADSRCRSFNDSSSNAFPMWEEAQKTLRSAMLLQRSNEYAMVVVRREKETRLRDDSVLYDEESEVKTSTLRPFFAYDTVRVAAEGYVIRGANDQTTYAAPDEASLLSDEFARTHCMRLGPGDRTTARILFTPTADRLVPDIQGIIVLDRQTGLVREVAFSYVNAARPLNDAHGLLEFRQLAVGALVWRWSLDLPVIEKMTLRRVDGSGSLRTANTRIETVDSLVARKRVGGEVWSVSREGSLVWRGATSSLSVSVSDSLNKPVARTFVTLVGTGEHSTADSAGKATFQNVRVGLHRLLVTSPTATILRLPGIVTTLWVAEGGTSVRALLPSKAALLSQACPDVALPGIAVGTVRSSSGERVSGASISAVWRETIDGIAQERRLTQAVNSVGDFFFCKLPRNQTIVLEVTFQGLLSATVELLVPESGLVQRDVQLNPKKEDADHTASVPR